MADPIRFAVPNGSMQERTLQILRTAGYALPTPIGRDDRIGVANGIEFFLRDRENIGSLVQRGAFDAGITGTDLMLDELVVPIEHVSVVCQLPYSRATNRPAVYVLAARVGTMLDVWKAQRPHRIGAERINLARQCLYAGWLERGDELVKLPGKEESAVADGLCDSVFVLTETGASLRAHGLEVVKKLYTSAMVLIHRHEIKKGSDQLRTLEALGLAMCAILQAEQAVLVTFDLRRDALSKLDLPAAVSPTISQTLDPAWVAGQVLIERSQFPAVLLQLQAAHTRGIFRQDVDGYLPE